MVALRRLPNPSLNESPFFPLAPPRFINHNPAMPSLPPPADPDAPPVLRCSLHLRREGDFCRGFVRDDDSGEVLFDEYVATRGLIESLRGDTEGPIMTCSCTFPGCAGFYYQKSLLFEHHIGWTLRYEGEDLKLLFTRDDYENEALSALRLFVSPPWEDKDYDWGTVPDEYGSEYAVFVKKLRRLFAKSSRLAAKWKSLGQNNATPKQDETPAAPPET